MGLLRGEPPIEPLNLEAPKEKIPPSEATSQYPRPDGWAAMPTMGLLSGVAPVEPKKPALPKAKIPPSEATSQ